MNELPQGPAAYELRSVGALRCHTARREFQMQLLLCEVESGRFVRTWVPLSRLPLLTLGSQWRNRQAIRVRREELAIRPDFGASVEWLPAPHRPGHQALDTGGWLDPTFPHPAGLWRFQTADGVETWLPVTEVIRSHYLFDPRLLPSIVGGLASLRQLSRRARQAWYPELTRWRAEPGGVAQIAPAAFLKPAQAFRLARVLFEPQGVRGLDQMFSALRELRARSQAAGGGETRRPFPPVGLPYMGTASWDAETQALPPGPDGVPRQLILRIVRHSAPPPWTQLEVIRSDAKRAASPQAAGAEVVTQARPAAFRLLPMEQATLTATSLPTDSRFLPLYSRDVRTVDQEAQQFHLPALPITEGEAGPADRRKLGRRAVAEGGDREPGSGGEGRPVILPNDSEALTAWPYATLGDDLRPILDVLMDSLAAAAPPYKVLSRYRPSRDEAYAFQMPARGRSASDKRIRPRQFLILECQGLTGFAYAIEPSRRTLNEHFPVGIVWSPGLTLLNDEDIQEIARDCEVRKRLNHSWIGDGVIGGGELQIRAVDHPPQGTEVSARISGFVHRLRSALLTALQLDPQAHPP